MNTSLGHEEWDNRILSFDGEDYVCVGLAVDKSEIASGKIFYLLKDAEVDVTIITGEVWVPLAQSFLAIEALDGVSEFRQINMTGNWSIDAPEPKHDIHIDME